MLLVFKYIYVLVITRYSLQEGIKKYLQNVTSHHGPPWRSSKLNFTVGKFNSNHSGCHSLSPLIELILHTEVEVGVGYLIADVFVQ